MRDKQVVRLAWIIGAVIASVTILASLPGYLLGFPVNTPVQASAEAMSAFRWIGIITSLTVAVVSLFLSAVLIWRKPNERMAVFVSFYLVVYGPVMGGPLEALSSYLDWGQSFSASVQTIFLTTPTIAFFCLFPSGQFIPRWSRWLIVLSLPALIAALYLPAAEWLTFSTPRAQLAGTAVGLLSLAAMYAQIHRYRRISTSMERQQTKWVVLGLLIWIASLAFSSIPYVYTQSLPPDAPRPWWILPGGVTWWLGLAILPCTLSIAILRHRLFDVDLLVRRTFIYGMLTVILATFYLGSVILLQQFFRFITGQSSELAIIVSTLGIAALFNPMRRRVQNIIDRRFYRRKYDAQKVLAAFGATLRDEVDLSKLTDELVDVVSETIQPQSAQLWLRPMPKHQTPEVGA